MSAGNRNRGMLAHQFCENFDAANNRNAISQRRFEFRVTFLDRRRDHETAGTFNIFGLVANRHLDAAGDQALHIRPVMQIRTLDLVTDLQHHIRNGAHNDTANSHDVKRSQISGILIMFSSPNLCPDSYLTCGELFHKVAKPRDGIGPAYFLCGAGCRDQQIGLICQFGKLVRKCLRA